MFGSHAGGPRQKPLQTTDVQTPCVPREWKTTRASHGVPPVHACLPTFRNKCRKAAVVTVLGPPTYAINESERRLSTEPPHTRRESDQNPYDLGARDAGEGVGLTGPDQLLLRKRLDRCMPYPSEPAFKEGDSPNRSGFLPRAPHTACIEKPILI